MPSVQKAHERFQGKDVAILVISIDGMGLRAVAPFMAAHAYTFPSLVDQHMEVARKFGMRLVPTTYVLDREWKIVGAGWGPVDVASDEFVQFVESVLTAS
jgi:peroxiredoxin